MELQILFYRYTAWLVANQPIGPRLTLLQRLLVAAALTAFTMCAAQARAERERFMSFTDFVQRVNQENSREYLARRGSKVKDAAAFEEMHQYILDMYRGVHVKHSYVLGSQTIDCVPIAQQPSVRDRGSNEIAPEPPTSAVAGRPSNEDSAAAVTPSRISTVKTTDEFGNIIGCEERSIPVRRITLEQLSNFRTLREFLQKGPNSTGDAPNPSKEQPPTPPGVR